MRKKLLLISILLTACAPNLVKQSDTKATPVASKFDVYPTPSSMIIATPVVSISPSDYKTSEPTSTPFFVAPEKTCLSFATPIPVKIDPNAPDIAGDFAPNFVPLKGVVYDKDKKTISDATIKMEVISKLDRGGCTLAQTKTDSFGNYSFTDTLYNTKIKLTLSKVGYKEISRTENINDHRLPLDLFSIIDFGGDNPKDSSYFLEKI